MWEYLKERIIISTLIYKKEIWLNIFIKSWIEFLIKKFLEEIEFATSSLQLRLILNLLYCHMVSRSRISQNDLLFISLVAHTLCCNPLELLKRVDGERVNIWEYIWLSLFVSLPMTIALLQLHVTPWKYLWKHLIFITYIHWKKKIDWKFT